MRHRLWPYLTLPVLLHFSHVGATELPAALVMTIIGNTEPPLSVMTEIPADTPIRLGTGSTLGFLDYSQCKLITVTGGSLTITQTNFTTNGKIVSEQDGPCPRVHQLASGAGAVAGGIVMRGASSLPRWPLDQSIVFAGRETDKLTGAAIYAEGQLSTPLARLNVSGHRAQFPPGSKELTPNEQYVLRLTTSDQAQPFDIPFIGVVPDGSNLLIVLR